MSADQNTNKTTTNIRAKLRRGGFTLLEVMVALVIFSICAATLIQQSGRNTRQSMMLETRTQANWIAENQLERLRLAGFPASGKTTQTITFSKQEWLIESVISDTNNADLRKAVIQVSIDDDHSTGYSLTGFLGRY